MLKPLTDEGPMLETLDYTIHISSTPTILNFDLHHYSAYAAHYVYFNISFCFLEGIQLIAHNVYRIMQTR